MASAVSAGAGSPAISSCKRVAFACTSAYASGAPVWYVTGQPQPDAYAQIASAGIGTVISLRLAGFQN